MECLSRRKSDTQLALTLMVYSHRMADDEEVQVKACVGMSTSTSMLLMAPCGHEMCLKAVGRSSVQPMMVTAVYPHTGEVVRGSDGRDCYSGVSLSRPRKELAEEYVMNKALLY